MHHPGREQTFGSCSSLGEGGGRERRPGEDGGGGGRRGRKEEVRGRVLQLRNNSLLASWVREGRPHLRAGWGSGSDECIEWRCMVLFTLDLYGEQGESNG